MPYLLLDTQGPLPVGPLRAHLRRRVNADTLARLAGLRRPDAHRDPVHFRLVGVKA